MNLERLQALKILIAVVEKQKNLNLLLKDPGISPFSKELCYGVCRYYYRLQSMADCLLKKRPKAQDLYLCILLGLYQIEMLKLPAYAVVKETVALLDSLKKPGLKGLANAVLRNFIRQQERILEQAMQNPLARTNHPLWLLQNLQSDYPEDWQQILNENDKQAPMSLRVNRLKIQAGDYLKSLESAGIMASLHQYASSGIQLTAAVDVKALPGFKDGLVSVQDQAAQLAVALLDLQPGQRILDACAAPGGKTGAILEYLGQFSKDRRSTLLALDIEARRLEAVRENLQRLGLEAELKTADVLQPEQYWDGKHFDRILLDAPCSATGVIRRHPDIKILRTENEVRTIAERQQAMLDLLWPMLAPGGRLVYATCSVLSIENKAQIQRFLKTRPEAILLDPKVPWGRYDFGQQILPGESGMDGFFYAVLQKKTRA